MDVWINFTHATKWQAEGIFKCFFPHKTTAVTSSSSAAPTDTSQKNLPVPKRKVHTHAIPLLTEEEISELAKRFAEAIPEDELSVRMLNLSFTRRFIFIYRSRVFRVTFSEIRRVPESAWKKSPNGSFKSVKLGKNSRRRRLRFELLPFRYILLE
jgi:hypothetical protein